jgi:hypothetical protein
MVTPIPEGALQQDVMYMHVCEIHTQAIVHLINWGLGIVQPGLTFTTSMTLRTGGCIVPSLALVPAIVDSAGNSTQVQAANFTLNATRGTPC